MEHEGILLWTAPFNPGSPTLRKLAENFPRHAIYHTIIIDFPDSKIGHINNKKDNKLLIPYLYNLLFIRRDLITWDS